MPVGSAIEEVSAILCVRFGLGGFASVLEGISLSVTVGICLGLEDSRRALLVRLVSEICAGSSIGDGGRGVVVAIE